MTAWVRGAVAIGALALVLGGCAGHSGSPVNTGAVPTASASAAPPTTTALDCADIGLVGDDMHLAPPESEGSLTPALRAASVSSGCTWIFSIWKYTEVIIIPADSDAVPERDCRLSDEEGSGDHPVCSFDAVANGYRLSAFIGGAPETSIEELEGVADSTVEAFTVAAESAEPGVPLPSTEAVTSCADLSAIVPGLEPSDAPAAPLAPGPTIMAADLYARTGGVICQDAGRTASVAVLPSVPAEATEDFGNALEEAEIAGAVIGGTDGDTFGSTAYALVGADLLVSVSKAGFDREQIVELAGRVLAAL